MQKKTRLKMIGKLVYLVIFGNMLHVKNTQNSFMFPVVPFTHFDR